MQRAGNTRSLAHTLLSRVTPARGRKVYMLDFAAYKPDEECVPRSPCCLRPSFHQQSTTISLRSFCTALVKSSAALCSRFSPDKPFKQGLCMNVGKAPERYCQISSQPDQGSITAERSCACLPYLALALRRELTTGEELLAWAVQSELFTTPALLEMIKIYLDEHWGVGDRTALPTGAQPPSPACL